MRGLIVARLFQVAEACHFEGGECFGEEGRGVVVGFGLRCGVKVGGHLNESAVVGTDEIEQGDAISQGGASYFVGTVQVLFVRVVQECQKCWFIVLGQTIEWGAHVRRNFGLEAGFDTPNRIVVSSR